MSTPNLFSFRNNTTRTIETTRTILVIASTNSNISINARGTFHTTRGGNTTGFFTIAGASSSREGFCGAFSTLGRICNGGLYPAVVPCVRNGVAGYCIGLVANVTFSCSRGNGTAGIPMPRSDIVRRVASTFVRTITAASSTLVRGFFRNRGFAGRRVLGNLYVNVFSNSVCPMCTMSNLAYTNISRLLCNLT